MGRKGVDQAMAMDVEALACIMAMVMIKMLPGMFLIAC